MADELEKTGDNPQPSEVVSKEDFTKLQSMFEQVQKAQKGSDQKVQEVLQENQKLKEELKKTAETANLDKVDILTNQLNEMNKKLEDSARQAAREKFIAEGYKKATDLGLPTILIDNFSGNDEGLDDYLKSVKQTIEDREAKIKNELVSSGYKPNSGGAGEIAEWNHKEHTEAENLKHYEAETQAYYDKLGTA